MTNNLINKNYKVVNILSPTMRIVFEGTYDECVFIKNKLGFGYTLQSKIKLTKKYNYESL